MKLKMCMLSLIVLVGIHCSATYAQYIEITDRDRYYEVIIDYEQAVEDGKNAYDIGREYGAKALETQPMTEVYLSTFVSMVANYMQWFGVPFDQLMDYVELIKPQIHPNYRAEIEGLASNFQGGLADDPGDEKISLNELFFLHLMPDLFLAGCSATSMYGLRSETGETMTASLMDYSGGQLLSMLHAVTTIRNGEHSVGMIGFLGIMNASTMFNDDGVYMGHIDSKVEEAEIIIGGKRSMFFDIRYAFERETSLQGVANYLKDPQKQYTFGFVVSLADVRGAQILEIDQEHARALRKDSSPLNPGVAPWNFDNAVAAVNSFVLEGNSDNHTDDDANSQRWANYIRGLTEAGDSVTWEELKQIVSYDGENNIPESSELGDIYNDDTVTITVFRPRDFKLEVFFRPRGSVMPQRNPDFIEVPVRFPSVTPPPLPTTPTANIPEPATFGLVGCGVLGLLILKRRLGRKKLF